MDPPLPPRLASSQVGGAARPRQGGGGRGVGSTRRGRRWQVRRRQRLGFWYRLVVGIAKPLLLVLTKRDWRGAENVPAEGGIIVAANHVSELDPLIVGHFLYELRRAPRFLAKEELWRKAPMKW